MGVKFKKILAGIGSTVVPGLAPIIDQFVEDKDKAKQLTAQLSTHVVDAWSSVIQQAGNVIMAEAQGESWLQRNWRPLTMMVFVFIIANNYIIAPYVSAFGGNVPTLMINSNMWDLLKLGLGGYIVGRSAEKGLKIWKTEGGQ